MRNHTGKIFKIIVVLFLLSILVINSKRLTNPARAKVINSSSHMLKFFHAVISAPSKMIPFSALREENRVLRERINLLSRRLEEAKMVVLENERLKNLINFRKTIPYATVPALVVGRDPTNWSGSLIIDKGTMDGILQNRAVLSTKGLVGRVVETGRRSSKILLITDPNSKVGVVIQRNRQGGILVGRPDGVCKMVYIALDSDVMPGDKVMTAGFGSIFPKDILVGEVLKVGKEPGRLYKYAIVKTAADLSRLEEVLCIR